MWFPLLLCLLCLTFCRSLASPITAKVVVTGPGSVVVDWDVGSASGIDAFLLQVTESGGLVGRALKVSSDTREGTIEDLKPETDYDVILWVGYENGTVLYHPVIKIRTGPADEMKASEIDPMALQDVALEKIGPNAAVLSWSPPESLKDTKLHYMPSYTTTIHGTEHRGQTEELNYTILFDENDDYILAGVYYSQTFENGTNSTESRMYPNPPVFLNLKGTANPNDSGLWDGRSLTTYGIVVIVVTTILCLILFTVISFKLARNAISKIPTEGREDREVKA